MSNTSPVNPFSPTAAYAPTVDGSDGQMSGFTKAILIIFLVLGILGIFGSLIAVGQLIIGSAVSANAAVPADGDGAQAPNINLNVFPGALAIQIAMQFVGMILSALMVISGVMGLKHRISGLNLVRWTAAGSAAAPRVEAPGLPAPPRHRILRHQGRVLRRRRLAGPDHHRQDSQIRQKVHRVLLQPHAAGLRLPAVPPHSFGLGHRTGFARRPAAGAPVATGARAAHGV